MHICMLLNLWTYHTNGSMPSTLFLSQCGHFLTKVSILGQEKCTGHTSILQCTECRHIVSRIFAGHGSNDECLMHFSKLVKHNRGSKQGLILYRFEKLQSAGQGPGTRLVRKSSLRT